MTIHDLFMGDVMRLPKERNEDDFEKYLLQIFREYMNKLQSLDDSCHLCQRINSNYSFIENLAGWIRGSVSRYFEGQPEKAYKELHKGIIAVESRLNNLKSLVVNSADLTDMYRMRQFQPNNQPLGLGDIFHIPFQLRHFVDRQRYSIPGLPCLYLGNSLQLCWHELGGPPLGNVFASKFRSRHGIKFLDFAYKPHVLAPFANIASMQAQDTNPQLEEFLISYAMCWPLIAASSIRPQYPNAPFIPEYVIPQIILQWLVRESDCDGIRYFSTRWLPTHVPDQPQFTSNFVFPVRRKASSGYCQNLKNKFEMTAPLLIEQHDTDFQIVFSSLQMATFNRL